MAGERIVVTPPSMSKSPAAAPARAPVTRSFVPENAVPSCLVPLEVVVSGSPRSHRPVVAVSVPPALRVQPWSVSKSSKNTVVGAGGVTVRDRPAFRVSAPLTPWTWKGEVPVAWAPETVTVSVLLMLPPAGGVTGLAEKPQEAPPGRPVHDRVTALLKPFCEATVQVLVPL